MYGITRFEKCRILGARALQVSLGAPVLMEGLSQTDPISIAGAEFERNIIPINIMRTLPDGCREKMDDWK